MLRISSSVRKQQELYIERDMNPIETDMLFVLTPERNICGIFYVH
jgi:hypothetical protein